MKAWKRYLFITLPLSILASIINFYVKDDTTPPPVEEYTLIEFEKDEYQIRDMVTGDNLGSFFISKDCDELFFTLFGASCSGTLMIGEYGDEYDFMSIIEDMIKIEKIKCKNLEFYAGKVGDWHTAVIMSLDRNDFYEYYKSDGNRYLLYILKNGDYNFSVKDDSVYDLYLSFGTSIIGGDMRYAAILE